MKRRNYHIGLVTSIVMLACLVVLQQPAFAQPFGLGLYGADVPFGNLTSLSINLGSSVSMTLAPSGPNFSGSGSQTVGITSTDVVGYSLYINNPTTTSMSNGTDTIPASSNVSAAPLAVNSWGYNTNGSSNYIGLTTTQTLIADRTGPYKSGDNTTVTYGALINGTKSDGTYTVNVTYTAVGKS